MKEKEVLRFRGGLAAAFIPLAIFLVFCVLYFVVFKAFEMHALAMGAFVGLMAGSLLAKKYDRFWDAVISGVADKVSVSIVLILFVIGMFSAMIKACNVSGGFVWLANTLHVSGGLFTAFTFIAICVIATATGSSIGTLFTAFPIFFPAGVIMGAHPAVLAGAILSGAIFGDNLAPISDTTIMSASTQTFKNGKTADIGGCVSSRLKYSIAACAISFVLFLIFGGSAEGMLATDALDGSISPNSLIMLVPVAIMLFVSIKTRSIFKAITVGLILGSIVGLLAGLITPATIISVTDGTPGGFLTSGIESMMGTVTLVISVFGIMGVLREAGAFEYIVEKITHSKLGKTVVGTEIASAIGVCVTTALFGGVTSAAIITFGPILNQLGTQKNIHPYRRANLLDGFANSIPVVIPFLSVFVYIGAILVQGYDFVGPISATQVAAGMFYPIVFFFVLLFAVLTGWGRTFEETEVETIDHTVVEPAEAVAE